MPTLEELNLRFEQVHEEVNLNSFDCGGSTALDEYLRVRALPDQRIDRQRTYLLLSRTNDTDSAIGFFCIEADSMPTADVPK